MKRTLAVAAAGFAFAAALRAQAPAFEVSSIKRNTSGVSRQSIGGMPGGRFVARNVTALDLMHEAFALTSGGQLVGGPGGLESERFDIEAKANSDVPWSRMLEMVQTLLRDRFRPLEVLVIDSIEHPVED